MNKQVQRPVLRLPWRTAFRVLRAAAVVVTVFVHLMWWHERAQRRVEVDAAFAKDAVRRAQLVAWQAWQGSVAQVPSAVSKVIETSSLTVTGTAHICVLGKYTDWTASVGKQTCERPSNADDKWAVPPSLPPIPRLDDITGGRGRPLIRCESVDQTRHCVFLAPP